MTLAGPADLLPHVEKLRGKIALPDESAVRDLLTVAFYAGLERDEGRDLTFTLAFLTPEDVDTPKPGPRPGLTMAVRPEFGALVFEKPLPFEVREVAKLASAVDPRRAAIGVRTGPEGLEIWGLYRHGSSEFLRLEGQVSGSVGLGIDYLRVTCSRPGSVFVDAGDRRIAVLAGGRVSIGGVKIFFDNGLVQSTLFERANTSSLPGGEYLQSVQQIVWRMREAGHGGTLLLLPDRDPRGLRPGKYWVATGSSAQVDLRDRGAELRRAVQVNADCTVAAHKAASTRTPDVNVVSALEIQAGAARAGLQVATRAFMDSIGFAAGLTGIDGALVLAPDLSVIAFGAMIDWSEGDLVDVVLCTDAIGSDGGRVPVASTGGSRHQSTAHYCAGRPGALAFVVSHDGAVSCLFNQGERLLLWKDVRLDRRHSPAGE